MASPTDAGRVATNVISASSSWTVSLPASIAAGDTLIMYVRFGGSTSPATPSGWTSLNAIVSADAADDGNGLFYKKATGSEGTSMSYSPGGSEKGAAIVWRVTGAKDPTVIPPEIGNITPAIGTGANLDAQNITPANPGGTQDYLFITVVGLDGETQTFTAPANYGNTVSGNSGTSGSAASNNVIAGASRQATVSTESVSTWTHAAPSSGVSSWTIAVYPSNTTIPYVKSGYGKEHG